MISRRHFLLGIASSTFSLSLASVSADEGAAGRLRPETVSFSGYRPGTLVVDTANHNLYLQLAGGKAKRYKIGVGRAGLAFKGEAEIGRKAKWPRWTPTRNMIRRSPEKYARFADGVPAGPDSGRFTGVVSISWWTRHLVPYSRNDPAFVYRSISFQRLYSHAEYTCRGFIRSRW